MQQINKTCLAKMQQINKCWMDGWTLLPDRKEDRSLHEGVLSLLDDHSSNICR
jgi:hypothetical protein